MVNVGIVGAGFMGTTHARAYSKNPAANISYVCDLSDERAQSLASEIGGLGTTQFEQIINDSDVSLVDVALPTPFHAKFAIDALNAGKHVLVEKPIALNVQEADEMIAASEDAGRFLMVAHVARFAPEYRAIRSVLESGRLGKPQQATTYRISNMPQWAAWFEDPAMTGGAVLDMQIHDIDLLNWLFGIPLRVMATGVKGGSGGWDHVMTLVEYKNVQASIESSFIMPMDFPFTTGFRVLCENGLIEYFFRAGGASFEIGEPQSHVLIFEAGKPPEPVELETGDGFERELEYFVDCVEENKKPEYVTAAEARLAVQVALASRQSIEGGTIETIG
jgi:UDP-N-acetylglucosamine 3-dehydrogenase